jgi:hypothetical protein
MTREDIKMLFCGDLKDCFVSHLKPVDAFAAVDKVNEKLVGYPWSIILCADGIHLLERRSIYDHEDRDSARDIPVSF